uniref:Uncharacterized protein n=1 Tax=Sarcophilus harrisii TaxID=9305 RepID=A0A7N4UXT0_SARHA
MNSSKKHFKEKEWVTSTRMGTAGSLEPEPMERPRHLKHMKNKHCSGSLGSGSDEDLGAQKGSSRLPDQVEDRSGSQHGRENGQIEPKRKREKRDEALEAANGSKASSGGGSSLSIKDTNKLQAQLGLGPLQVMAAQEKAPEIQDSRSQKGQGSRRESIHGTGTG